LQLHGAASKAAPFFYVQPGTKIAVLEGRVRMRGNPATGGASAFDPTLQVQP